MVLKNTKENIEGVSFNGEQKAKGKILSGVVVSDKMKDTVVVAVTRYKKHVKYQKYIKHVKRFKAHDKGNTHVVGDTVQIQETRPISRHKRFRVIS